MTNDEYANRDAIVAAGLSPVPEVGRRRELYHSTHQCFKATYREGWLGTLFTSPSYRKRTMRNISIIAAIVLTSSLTGCFKDDIVADRQAAAVEAQQAAEVASTEAREARTAADLAVADLEAAKRLVGEKPSVASK